MFHYIFQVRQMCVATTQTDLTIKNFFYVNLYLHLNIYHQHKFTILFITYVKQLISWARSF